MSNETCVLALFMAAQKQKLGHAKAADAHRKGSHGLVVSTGARREGTGKGNKEGGVNGASLNLTCNTSLIPPHLSDTLY